MCLEFSERGGTYPGLPVRKDIEFLGLPKFSFDHPGHSLLSVHFWQYPNDTKRKDMTEEQVAASITESDRNLAEEATQEAKAGSDPYVSSIIKDESSESDSHLFSSSDRSEVPPELPPIAYLPRNTSAVSDDSVRLQTQILLSGMLHLVAPRPFSPGLSHVQCVASHIDSKLSERNTFINCPDMICKKPISTAIARTTSSRCECCRTDLSCCLQIVQTLPPHRSELHSEILFDSLLLENVSFMRCPSAQCGEPLERPNHPGCPVACPLCNVELCLLCKKESHLGANCETHRAWKIGDQEAQVTYGIYRRKSHLKMCPKCGVDCIKISGCNDVRCPVCRHVFSWWWAVREFISLWNIQLFSSSSFDAQKSAPRPKKKRQKSKKSDGPEKKKAGGRFRKLLKQSKDGIHRTGCQIL
jgi:hypothetical protein